MTGSKRKIGLTTALLVLAGAYVLIPLYWLLVSATKTTHVLFDSQTFLPYTAGTFIGNIGNAFSVGGGELGIWLANSAIYAGVTGIAATYFATALGYAIAKFQFAGRYLLANLVIGSLMVPSTVLIVPVFIMESHLHLTNSYEGVILPLCLFPFGAYFMSIYCEEAIPSTILDAGRVDGAGDIYLFHRVALPLLLPGMVTLFLIDFIGTWNNYFLPLVLLSSNNLLPAPVGLADWLGRLANAGLASQPLYPELITGAFVSVLPMLVLFPFLQRYIARGLSLGALAGE
ncbi:MAG TPA: carbohydrate ABC transporter permease [Acidimicrobiales bacterium]|nr:carbohydrate ABC transporter permease [Acidimicrobiales bacterium]